MITAKEASDLTRKAQGLGVIEDIKSIEENIRELAATGHSCYSFYYNDGHTQADEDRIYEILEEAGYDLNYIRCLNCLEIKW